MIQTLIDASESQYLQNIERKGDAEAWLGDEPRYHIYKACDELFQARDQAQIGQYYEALPMFADALNHIAFAMDIAKKHGEDHRHRDTEGRNVE